MMILIILICTAFVLMLCLHKNRISRMKMLTADIPGPKGYPFIGSPNVFRLGGITRNITKLWKDFGNIAKVWIGPKLFVVVNSPDDVRDILSKDITVNKSFIYDFLAPVFGFNAIFTANGEIWRKRRRIIAPSFNSKMVESFLDVFNSKSKILVETLEKEIGKPAFDISVYFDLCALDFITGTAMGVNLDIQHSKNNFDVSILHRLEEVVTHRAIRPWTYLDFIFNLSPEGKEQKRVIKFKDYFVKKVIESKNLQRVEKRKINSNNLEANEESLNEKKRQPFLDTFLDARENSDAGITDQDIFDEIYTIIIAGQTTTASALSFIIYALMKHQDVQEKVVSELNEIFEGSDRNPTPSDLQQMTYLDMVICEILRMWPSVPYVARKIPEDIVLKSGYTLPAGCEVVINLFALHRNPIVFPNPNVFDPERFKNDNSARRSIYEYSPFGAGTRTCIGKKYAEAAMKIVVSHLLRKYKVSAPTIDCPDIKLSDGILRSKTGVYIRIENR